MQETDTAVKNKIKKLCATLLKVDQKLLTDSATPNHIESWDSLNHLNIIATLESEFKIEIDPEEIVASRDTIGSVISMVLKKR